MYRPAGPDAAVHQFRAFDGNTPLEQWAIGTDAGGGGDAYDILLGRPGDWHHEETVGRCYTTQVAGSMPLHAFRENSPDPAHEDHFYAASEQYQRGVDHLGASRGVFCYVVPSGTPALPRWPNGGRAGATTTTSASPLRPRRRLRRGTASSTPGLPRHLQVSRLTEEAARHR